MKRFFGFAVLIVFFLLFAPSQIGGRTTYAIITGNSMEPDFHKGDLIFALTQSDYSKDDIVLYAHPDIGPVFHRIIGIENSRFVLKGDNNQWIDTYQPAQTEILGKFWFVLPWLGSSLAWLRSLEGFSTISATIGVLMIGTTVVSRNNPQNKKKRNSARASAFDRFLNNASVSVRDVFVICVGLSLLFVILGLFAFTKPTYITVPTNYPYEHFGEFIYSSDTGATVYDQGKLKPGDPIFRNISNQFDLQFSYSLLAEGFSAISGSYSLSLVVGENNGWSRTFELIPSTPFDGNSVMFSAPIRLSEIQAVVDSLEQATGIGLQQYILTIQPKIKMQGLAREITWQGEYAPALRFVVNDIQVRLDNSDAQSNQLSQTQTGGVFGSALEVNSLSFLGINLNIHWVRIFLILVSPVLLTLTIATAWRWNSLQKGDRASHIAGVYGPKLVDVSGRIAKHGLSDIEVFKIEDLARIAEREGAVILHEENNGTNYYFVDSQTSNYFYRLDPVANAG